jgi:hypothetical protein
LSQTDGFHRSKRKKELVEKRCEFRKNAVKLGWELCDEKTVFLIFRFGLVCWGFARYPKGEKENVFCV